MFDYRGWALIFVLIIHSQDLLGQVDSSIVDRSYDNGFKGRLSLRADTAAIVHRQFSNAEIQKLKSDPDLNFSKPPTVAESIWDQFKRWLWDLIAELFQGAAAAKIGSTLAYILGVVLLIYLTMSLLRVNAFRLLFSPGDVKEDNYNVLHENIHEMDFEKMINEAVKGNDFRLATRLIFLNALKTLADKHLLDWDPGKTNRDYLAEIKRSDLKEGFTHLSLYFDYAWYGNFEVSPQIFQRLLSTFHNWKDQVNR